MENIHSGKDLRRAIADLETRQDQEEALLKSQFNLTYEGIKPVNVLKNTLKEAVESIDFRENVLLAVGGMLAGYVTRKIFVGAAYSPWKKLLGAALIYGATNWAAKHPAEVKLTGRRALGLIRKMLGTIS